MRSLMVLFLTVCMIGGCTTMHPIANTPNDLSQHFGDGGVLKSGDRVIIRTLAGAKRHMRIRSVREEVIYGDHDSIPFSEIASIDRRDYSTAKTTILVIVIAGVVGVVAALAHAAEHPDVGSF